MSTLSNTRSSRNFDSDEQRKLLAAAADRLPPINFWIGVHKRPDGLYRLTIDHRGDLSVIDHATDRTVAWSEPSNWREPAKDSVKASVRAELDSRRRG